MSEPTYEELKEFYISAVLDATYSHTDKKQCSMSITSKAADLRQLADWGIVDIEIDHGRMVVATQRSPSYEASC